MYINNIFHKKHTKKRQTKVKNGKKTPFFSNSRPPAHKGPWAVFLLPEASRGDQKARSPPPPPPPNTPHTQKGEPSMCQVLLGYASLFFTCA